MNKEIRCRNKGIVGVFYFLSKKSFFKKENRYNLTGFGLLKSLNFLKIFNLYFPLLCSTLSNLTS